MPSIDKFRADFIARLRQVPAEQFFMGVWINQTECGTVACAAGQAVLLARLKYVDCGYSGPVVITGRGSCSVNEAAQQLLHIPSEDAIELFTPTHNDAPFITAARAADVFERYFTTGVLDWEFDGASS